MILARIIFPKLGFNKMVPVLIHPLDSSPPDYYLLLKLNVNLKENHYETLDEIQAAVTNRVLQRVMQRLEDRIIQSSSPASCSALNL